MSAVMPTRNHPRLLKVRHPKRMQPIAENESMPIWYHYAASTSTSRRASPPRKPSFPIIASIRAGAPAEGACVKSAGDLKKSNARIERFVRSHETTTST